MPVIGANQIGVSYGETVILKDVTFSINAGDKVSIVGVNGAGKTTLMRVLIGLDSPTQGEVYLARDRSIGYLEQLSSIPADLTVYEAGLSVFRKLNEMEKRLAALSDKMKTDHSPELISTYSSLESEFNRLGGYQVPGRVRGTLVSLGFGAMLDLPVGALSGGQKTSLQLALLLLEEPDLIFLDEPTNHLDIKALEWLEDKLRSVRSTVLVISHDRFFLDKVTDKTIEIENTRAKLYPVPYSRYRELKKEEREIQERHYQNQQKEIARLEAFIEQQRRWNRERNIIAAESRMKAIDRMEKIERPENLPDSISFRFTGALESGDDVLTVKDLSKAYGENRLFEHLNFEVHKRERMLIIGANGTGKSTLLQILAGHTPPTSGEFRFGYNVCLGYYDQYQHLNENSTVLEELWQDARTTQTEIRKLLAAFLFRGDDVFKEIRVLSGGERARLVLAKLMQKKVNLLLLDEPTNHLDIESREALEEAILSFDGTVIAVSHDRYFINKIATSILEFRGQAAPGERVVKYEGGYADLLSYRERQKAPETVAGPQKSAERPDYEEQKRLKAAEQKKRRRIEAIEKEIEAGETRLAEIGEEINASATDYLRLQELYQEKETIEKKCEALLAEWNDLETS